MASKVALRCQGMQLRNSSSAQAVMPHPAAAAPLLAISRHIAAAAAASHDNRRWWCCIVAVCCHRGMLSAHPAGRLCCLPALCWSALYIVCSLQAVLLTAKQSSTRSHTNVASSNLKVCSSIASARTSGSGHQWVMDSSDTVSQSNDS